MTDDDSVGYDLDAALEKQRDIRNGLAKEIFTEVWAKLPFGHSFRLSDGSEATIEQFGGVHQNEDGDWVLSFDAKIKGRRDLDHIEITMSVTGSGGFAIGFMEGNDEETQP